MTAPYELGDAELRLGLDFNNGPTVQDPYNSTYAWGYPYVASALSAVPSAQPLLAGALAGNSYGITGYAWYDRSLYLEGGLYGAYGPSLLHATGNTYSLGSTANPAPYLRAAYEWDWNGQTAHVGGILFHVNFNPAAGPYTSDGSAGRDSYTDYAVDAGYQFIGDGEHTLAVLGIFDHEQQNLTGSTVSGASSQSSNTLNQVRMNATYYYQQTYGATAAWQKTWGTPNPALYGPAPVFGSANGKPDSNAFTIEADWAPFGKTESWASPWVNLKLGVQYTIYTEFNGGRQNYDGFGRNANDNNTLYVFAWFIF